MSSAVGTAVAEVYAAGLCATGNSAYEPIDWRVRYHDGAIRPLELVRWSLESWPGDEQLLDRCRGPVLDVGCGPGRLTRALRARVVPALGIDVAPAAVRLARRRGADVLQRSVFGAVPAPGSWRSVVLADGNVGIGGDARRLLRRVHQLLRAGGQVLCEVDPPGTGSSRVRVRLEGPGGRVSSWFAWAHVDADGAAELAADTGLRLDDVWRGAERWFVTMTK